MFAPFHPLELRDQALVRDRLGRRPTFISELTFASLLVWGDAVPVWIAEVEDSLILLEQSGREPSAEFWVCGPPLGPISPASIPKRFPRIAGFRWIPKETADVLKGSGYAVSANPDQFDYVYRVADLADLPGARYHNKRNLVAHCLEEHSCQYEPIGPANLDECRIMLDAWCAARSCRQVSGLCDEYLALQQTFRYFDALHLFGGAIRVDDRIQALAIGEPLGPDMAVCHFEKAMPAVHGLGQLMNQWFAIHALKGFEWVNREQDLGLPGLRQAKQSYGPVRMVEKFTAVVPRCVM